MSKSQVSVYISENLMESMTLASIEAYCLGDGRRSDKNMLETLGYIWGYKKAERDQDIFFLDRMSLSLSARRTKNSVEQHERAAELKNDVVNKWSPHVTLYGDFHSHPYSNIEEVKSEFISNDYVWKKSSDMPIMLVLTICRMERVRESSGAKRERANLWRFDVGEFRCWLNAAVGYMENRKRCHSGNKHSHVQLNLYRHFLNQSGDRIDPQ
jgi:hypothetical protein